jgi:arginine decarboxylase
LQHCLIPHPKQLLIDRDEKGNIVTKVFKEQQKSSELLSILGYGEILEKESNTQELIKEEVL